ncbi:MAG: hypothetical protein H0U65_11950 [Rubrobacter sp.]|nr:hypothetical protein [Rubrobacter sp.]
MAGMILLCAATKRSKARNSFAATARIRKRRFMPGPLCRLGIPSEEDATVHE